MESSLIQQCDQCGRPYRVEDNRPESCSYHLGDVHDHDRAFSRAVGAQGDFWDCCGRQITSDDPFAVPGCAVGPHAPAATGTRRRELLGQQRRDLRNIAASLAEQHVSHFLRNTEDLSHGERWRTLFTALGTLGGIAPAAVSGLLTSAEFPAERRRQLLPLVRDPAVRAALAAALGPAPAAPIEPQAEQEWRLDRLFTTFPSLLPDGWRGAASTPITPIDGSGSDEDPRGRVEPTVIADVRVVPSGDFVIRLNLDRVSEEWRARAGQEAARGILKAAVRLVTPPALAGEITSRVRWCGPDVSDRAFHVAAYRAFQHASRDENRPHDVKWTFANPFPDVDPPAPDESLEAAHERITLAFLHAGFDVDCSEGTRPRVDGVDILRSFKVFLAVESGPGDYHFFFVCPYPWTHRSVAAFEALWHQLSYDLGHDGYGAVKHLIATHPYPEANPDSSANPPVAEPADLLAENAADSPIDSPVSLPIDASPTLMDASIPEPGQSRGLEQATAGHEQARSGSRRRGGHPRGSLARLLAAFGVAYRPDQPLATRVAHPFRVLGVFLFLLLGPVLLALTWDEFRTGRATFSYRGHSTWVKPQESSTLFWFFILFKAGAGLCLSLLSLALLYGAFTQTDDEGK